jgi:hypothetical protein
VQLVSPAFADAVKQSHTALCEIDVLDPIGGIRTPSLPVIDGTFTASLTDAVHRSAQLVLPDDETVSYIPQSIQDPLSPYTARIQASLGIQLSTGPEMVKEAQYQLATFGAKEASGGSSAGRTLTLGLMDVSSRCQLPLPSAVALQGGSLLTQAIPQLLLARVKTLSFRLPETLFTVPPLLIQIAGDAWAQATKLANMGGFELLITRDGSCAMVPRIGGAARDPVWSFIEGVNADFWNIDRQISSDAYPNVVVVIGTNSAAPGITGTAADMDPSSPTYRYGPYGENVKTIQSALIVNIDQATIAAQGILARLLGAAETMTFDAIPNAALDIGDTVLITRPSMGLNKRRMLVSKTVRPVKTNVPMTVTVVRSVFTNEQEALADVSDLPGIMPPTLAGKAALS